MPLNRLPWPIVTDAFLTALVIQGVLAVAGHFVGFLGRHFNAASIGASLLMGFIFGVWSSPTPALISGLGGALVAGGSALAGATIVFFLGHTRTGALLVMVLLAAVGGAATAAVGSLVGRSVFGS